MRELIKFAAASAVILFSAEAYAAGPSRLMTNNGQTVFTKTVSPGGIKLDVASPQASPAGSVAMKADESTESFEVTITVDPDNEGKNKIPQGVWLIKDEYVSYQSMRKAVNKFTVPAGDYIAQIIFTNNDYVGSILFVPDIKVDGPKDIHVNASMADKKITTAFTLPSGEKAVLPEDNGLGGVADKPYNIATITADIHLTFDGISKGSVQSVIGMGGEKYSDLLTLRTNVDSPRGEVSYVVKADAPGSDGAKYFYLGATTMDKVGDEIVLTNNVRDFHKVSDIEIAHSPAYGTNCNDNKTLGIDFYAYSAASSLVGAVSAEIEGANDLYICTPAVDFSNLHALAKMYVVDYADEDEWIFDGITTPYFAYNGSDFEFYATAEDNSYSSDEPGWEKVKCNPALTFANAAGIKLGDNFAACVTAVQTDPWADVPFSYIAPDCYYGNYGEVRGVDLDLFEFSVKHNGTPLEVTEGQSLYDWSEKWAATDHEPGVMTYTFTNRNLIVDGIQGQNICEVSFDENADDTMPPTLQRVMIRDANGNVTNRFASPEGATIAVMGADFEKHQESRDTGAWPTTFTYYSSLEAACLIEYAAHGSSDFHEFIVENDFQKAFSPGFGNYFSGSLDQIDVQSADNWYDLRITFTDQAENTQTQTISPAFKIDRLTSGISDIETHDNGFEVAGNAIHAADGSAVRVYTLSGAEVPNSDLRSGLYIAVSAEHSAKIAVR